MENLDASGPLYVVLNAGSGHSSENSPGRTIREVLQGAGRAHELFEVTDASQLEPAAQHAADRARRRDGVVVGAGGDGTLNTVARAALDARCPFGVVPEGTFNYFARTHGIPTDTAAATRSLLDATVRPVPVGRVNERIFLVNASLGLYPDALEQREEQKQKHGRSRPVAAWAALLTVLQEHRPLQVRVALDGTQHELRTLTMFVGLNPLQLEHLGMPPELVLDGWLAGIVLKPVSTRHLLWLALCGAMGSLGDARGLERFAFSTLTVEPSGRARPRRMKVATDGETGWMTPPLSFDLLPQRLPLLVPARPQPKARQ